VVQVIEIHDLYKYYGDRRAVGPVSTSIEQGEIVGLLGLNGAGKTTTLRILACDLLPTSGTVRVDGVDVVERPDEVRARIGYLPDTPPVYTEMRVREYLQFAARLRGMNGADAARRVEEVMELTEVREYADDVIAALSHGFRQRVGIAQAIVHKPRLVVLDEPISGLDPVQIVEMRALVKNLGGEHTVVVSSHILNEISETCDRILVIQDGKIVASGSEAELSSQLAEGVRIELTVKGSEVESRAREALWTVPAVREVELVGAREAGADVRSFVVLASEDVRDRVSRSIIEAGLGLLELSRSERELERMFLQLSRGGRAQNGSSAGADAPQLTSGGLS